MRLDNVIAVDEEALRAVSGVGMAVRSPETLRRRELMEADLLITGPSSLERLRGWRAAGVRTPALLVQGRTFDLPEERAVLEPLVVVRDADPEGVRAALGRFDAQRVSAQVRVPGGLVDLARRQVIRGEGSHKLSQQQADLLAYLAARPGLQVTKEELLEQVWGYAPTVRSRAVEMAVSRLRKLIEPEPASPVVLLTCRGGGYSYVAPAETQVGRLPVPEGALVGRDDLLAKLSDTLIEHRTVVLVGAPGIGKSRLALQLAHEAEARGEDVRWCDLQDVEPEGLLTVLASALDVSVLATVGKRSISERLADGLLGRGDCLVVLDGVDEPLAGLVGPTAGELTQLCTQARFVLTSQVPLEDARLQVREVTGLPLSDAVALFESRARAAGATDLDGLEELLPHFDGVPMAIELAASRARSVPLAELTATGSDALEHAWERLSDQSRHDLASLSRCPPRFGLDLVRHVLEDDARERLVALVDRGLVQRQGEEFRLLGPIRQRARKLPVDGVEERVDGWLVELARRELDRSGGIEARAAAQELARWSDPLTALLQRRLGEPESADLALALAHLYRAHGTLPQRAAVLDLALGSLDVDQHPHEGARLLRTRGRVTETLAPERGHRDMLRALELARRAGDDELLGWCLTDASRAESRVPGGTSAYAEEAVAFCKARGLDAVMYVARFQYMAWKARRDPALRPQLIGTIEEGMERLLQLGFFFEALSMANALAGGLTTVGETERAARARARLRGLLEIFPDRWTRGVLLNVETWALADEGDIEAAFEAVEERRRLLFGLNGEPDGWLLRDRGELLVDLGRHVDAERDLLRALSVLDSPTSTCGCWGTLATSDLDRGLYERALTKADSALKADAYPFMQAISRLWRGVAALLLGRVEDAEADLDAIPFDVLGQDPALLVGLAKACLAVHKGDSEAFARCVDTVERYLKDDWVARAARTVLDALVGADKDALQNVVDRQVDAGKQVRWRILARLALRSLQYAERARSAG